MTSSNNNSALASLTATYTDSENEEEHADRSSPESESSNESQPVIPRRDGKSYTPTLKTSPVQASSASRSGQSTTGRQALRLVSYQDDAVVTDDENVSPNRDTVSMEISEDEAEGNKEAPNKTKPVDKYSHYGFSLPPEPKGKVQAELIEKIKSLYEKMDTNNMDMNKIIQEKKEFRNPSIYEKLIQFCDINEFGTNYPPEIYDPLQWGPESYYEELAKSQKVEMLKRQKERKETDKTDTAATAAKKAEEDAKKRKSKWDQPAPSTAASAKVPAPALTSNVTGTKGTVISAFGSLPKKVGNA